jgi:cytochrome b involved in lipid metabolism
MCLSEPAIAKTIATMPKAIPLDQLWLIHGRLYDLVPFIERHPGGMPCIQKLYYNFSFAASSHVR